MNSSIDKLSRSEIVFLLVLLLAGCVFFLANLGNHYLWQDEAQTALISKTILSEGVPKGYDGKNFFSQELGAEYGENYTYRWHTWFPFYVSALFFKLCGISTFTARFPFALFGIATVILTYFYTRRVTGCKRTAATAALLLLLCVPFLILSRQARYYSMTAFFSLLSLYAYDGILGQRKHAVSLLVLGATLLFHTHYIYTATLFAAIFVHVLLHKRESFKCVLLAASAVAIINLPWAIWLRGMKYGERYGDQLFDALRWILFTSDYISQLMKHVFPFWLIIVLLVVALIEFRKHKSLNIKNKKLATNVSLSILFLASNIAALAVASPAPFFRYLSPLLPIMCVLMAMIVNSAIRANVVLGVAAFSAIVATSALPDFVYELSHDFDGPIEGIVDYLKDNGDEDDIVLITYGDMPLKFYTDMRVYGGLTGEDLSAAQQADWVILRSYAISSKDEAVRFFALQYVSLEEYEEVVLDFPDTSFHNRESPEFHLFKTSTLKDRVVILRRKVR